MENRDHVLSHLHTVRDFARWGVSRFTHAQIHLGHGTDNAWDEALALIFHGLDIPVELSVELMPQLLDCKLTPTERQTVVTLIETRVHDRLPLPYITGHTFFSGLRFKVDERVLIPRSPIAELIEQGFQPWAGNGANRVLDLCCGSGCIGIACAVHLDASVTLADVSTDALEVARQNIASHQVEQQVALVQSNLYDELDGRQFDVIVCNPPYVGAAEFNGLPEEYRHEPALALEGGEDGLDLVRNILDNAAAHLSGDGLLVLEVGNSMVALEQAFPEVPFVWAEFSRGGHGVCMLTRGELQAHF